MVLPSHLLLLASVANRESVEVNQRALIDKVLARYSGEFTGEISWERSVSVLSQIVPQMAIRVYQRRRTRTPITETWSEKDSLKRRIRREPPGGCSSC